MPAHHQKIIKYAALSLFIIFPIIAFIAGVNYEQSHTSRKIPVNTPQPTAIPTTPVTITDAKPPVQNTSIVVPANWKRFTAADPDLKFQTTLALPPGYTFSFTGSEFMIQNDSDASELWEYSTSIMWGADGTISNSYEGQSRRVWYAAYLAQKQQNFQIKDTILSVTEVPINQSSYLVVSVESPDYNASGGVSGVKQGKHFVYVQNNIVHILAPSSQKAYTTEAQIPSHISTIFTSLATTSEL